MVTIIHSETQTYQIQNQPKKYANEHSDCDDLLDAISMVETGNDSSMIGTAGEIGAYQILPAYWKDATDFDPSIGGKYRDVLNDEYARTIIRSYWRRYATKERLGHTPTMEDRARMHNGGPSINNKYGTNAWNNTTKYWEKVKREMQQ